MVYETDVLIIGAGPTGSTTALALANCGVRAHVVSRSNWMADSPRAHITNQRANEVFRDLGIAEDEVHRGRTPRLALDAGGTALPLEVLERDDRRVAVGQLLLRRRRAGRGCRDKRQQHGNRPNEWTRLGGLQALAV